MKRLADELYKLRDGATSFASFTAATSPDFARMARYLMQRWAAPAGVEPVDVEQELRFAAWRVLPGWDPEKGPLDRYVTWNAMASAKKWLHHQRNARRRDDSAPGRYPVPFSALGRSGGFEDEDPDLVADAEQDAILTSRRRLAEVLEYLDDTDRASLVALVRAWGDVDAAAEVVYDDVKLRLQLRLGNAGDARKHVRAAVERAAVLGQEDSDGC